jgi:hypothetical protein
MIMVMTTYRQSRAKEQSLNSDKQHNVLLTSLTVYRNVIVFLSGKKETGNNCLNSPKSVLQYVHPAVTDCVCHTYR